MHIIRIREDSFLLWRSQIEALLNNSVKMNFPDRLIDPEYGRKKCDEVTGFLKDGTAVIFAAVDNDCLIGWVWCHHINRLGKERIHISEIAVRDEFRNHGIGTKLMNIVEMYAMNNGYLQIDLFVTESNRDAVDFYKRDNFQTERYLMVKTISK